MNRLTFGVACLMLMAVGCGAQEVRPVDIYPEDMCAYCRMAVSDQRFAAEIIIPGTGTFKFDDISCMEAFRDRSSNAHAMVVFVKDYETRAWVPVAEATIVTTSLATPMGSGKIAFADSARAYAFQRVHRPDISGEHK